MKKRYLLLVLFAGMVCCALSVWASGAMPPAYCIVDLPTGKVSYVDDLSQSAINSPLYKTDRMVLRLVAPRTFKNTDKKDVTISRPFYVGLFRVTQAQYQWVTGECPSYFRRGDTNAVNAVSFEMIRGGADGAKWPESAAVDTLSFLGILRMLTDAEFDLPTEAQWMLSRQDWDAWGTCGDFGTGWDWCRDFYSQEEPSGTDPVGASKGTSRVMRGGNFGCFEGMCPARPRGCFYPNSCFYYFHNLDFGFRIVVPCPEKL